MSEPAGVSGSGGPAGGGVRLGEDFSDRQLFPSDNWWNQDITNAPVDQQSAAFIDVMGRTRGANPDYGSESDEGFRGERGYPIPELARTQPDVIEGGEVGGGSSGDRHLLILDRDRSAPRSPAALSGCC